MTGWLKTIGGCVPKSFKRRCHLGSMPITFADIATLLLLVVMFSVIDTTIEFNYKPDAWYEKALLSASLTSIIAFLLSSCMYTTEHRYDDNTDREVDCVFYTKLLIIELLSAAACFGAGIGIEYLDDTFIPDEISPMVEIPALVAVKTLSRVGIWTVANTISPARLCGVHDKNEDVSDDHVDTERTQFIQ